MRKKTLKVSLRLSQAEYDMMTCLQYHHRTWDPSKTFRFALKVLGECSKESMTEEQRAKLISEYSARSVVEAVRVHDRIARLKAPDPEPGTQSDKSTLKSRTMPASSGKKKRPAKAAAG